MKRWITSDTHFGHKNIMDYCPWRTDWARSIEEHDARLIEAWNLVVAPEDVVFHLGDFALCKKERIAEIRKQLHGKIHLALGNHDRSAKSMTEMGFEVHETILISRAVPNDGVLIARHNPGEFPLDQMKTARLLLHGHWHGDDHRPKTGVAAEFRDKLIDVGIDARREIAPASLDLIDHIGWQARVRNL